MIVLLRGGHRPARGPGAPSRARDDGRALLPVVVVPTVRLRAWKGRSDYAASMEQIAAGDLVKVATAGPQIDGIVFDVPSASKVVVAVMDRGRGPVMRTVHRTALSERAEEGPDDRALRLLVRRTPHAAHGASRGGNGPAQGREGFKRAAMHRTTGK